ncbi:MAG: D-alanine--D-alanine ligase [Candidatus Omnitrophica bacterium]|nr:D-alanine--D-alanine ligase [Candidatus Omnitrophota bacterium]
MMELKEIKIAVLAGGISSEREISLRSGAAVHAALLGKGLDAVLLDVDERAAQMTKDAGADLAFIALHGAFGEDGRVQQALEDLGIPYTGSGPEACRRAMDKEVSRELFRAAGLAEPRWTVVTDLRQGTAAIQATGLPAFVKPCRGGSSIGVTQLKTEAQWSSAFESARAEDARVMVESKIKGRELAVGILGDHALPAIEICPAREFYDFEAKYSNSGTQYIFPEDISASRLKRIQETALRAHQALGCEGFSRVDLIMDEDTDYALEVNAIPGMTATSLLPKQARREGIQFEDLCVMMIQQRVRRGGS